MRSRKQCRGLGNACKRGGPGSIDSALTDMPNKRLAAGAV